jgi:hypothetical protein
MKIDDTPLREFALENHYDPLQQVTIALWELSQREKHISNRARRSPGGERNVQSKPR